MTLIQKLYEIISCRSDISQGELYFILSSVMMYFKTPLKTESWNLFKKRIEEGHLSLHEAIFLTDEEKNPHVWNKLNKKTKQELQNYLNVCLLNTRKYLLKHYPDLKPKPFKVDSCIVYVPDLHSGSFPTFFSKAYIKNQLRHKVYINELTGQPFSWEWVDQLQKNKLVDCTKISPKCIDSETFKKLIQREISKLNKLTTHCIHCKKRSTSFKSIKNYQTIYFCSLKCMNEWEFD
jgi:hypothetical protein